MKGCFQCVYWSIHGSEDNAYELHAQCRRYPPNTKGEHPTTNGRAVCGEWVDRVNLQDFFGRNVHRF